MNLTLVFSRKYRWPVHYFSVWFLGNSQKLLTTKQFLVSTILFTNIIFPCFFNLHFDHFSIITKKVNQIRNNVVYVVARLVFVFYCALTTSHCNAFQHIFEEIRVLRHIFPEYVISCDYVSMDVYPYKKINFMLHLFHEILDFQKSCNLIDKEDL